MSLDKAVAELVAESADPRLDCAPRWTRIRLGDAAEVISGYAFPSRFFGDEHGHPIIRIRDIARGQTTTRYSGPVPDGFWVEDGDLLVGMDGDFKARRWSGGRALLNQRVARVRAKVQIYSQPLIEEFLPAYLELLRDHTSSVTVRHLSIGNLREVPLPLPPVTEQARLAAAAEQLASKVGIVERDLTSALTRAEAFHARVAEAAFEPGEDWTLSALGEVGQLRSGIALGRRFKPGEELVQRPFLRVANVQRGRLVLDDLSIMPVRHVDAARAELRAGDVLMIEGGDRDKLGRGWVWENQVPGCIHQNHVFRLRLHPSDRLTPEYVSRYVNTVGQSWFDEHAKQTSNLASISAAAVAAMPLRVPPPGVAQRIAHTLAHSDRCLDDVAREIEQSRALIGGVRTAITAMAAQGRLSTTMPGDAAINENPAPSRTAPSPPPKTATQARRTRSAMKDGVPSMEEVLADQGPLSPEQLFAQAGFSPEEVERFYRTLLAAVERGRIRETADRRLAFVEDARA
ncbi:restriction endonuclease subunit S [Sphingomonas sp. PL-96]|uniref:restriction endonuclease subunit S n=1 Tax=Sphingomonas sp. PL-96 TaxID=2887201 RepID=UPI001E480916|nr:restriction endonuclease subunit S [Sphingomonas sp. PL-96]MCC2976262.1 restriction endonuclease subunit S [Sphingomonas sp. PL-96]